MKLPYSISTVNNKKTRTTCFSTLRFFRISPEPLELQKIYLHVFIIIFEELSAETRIFSNPMAQSADIGKNVNFSNKKLAIRKNPPF